MVYKKGKMNKQNITKRTFDKRYKSTEDKFFSWLFKFIFKVIFWIPKILFHIVTFGIFRAKKKK
tara:strand:+ start:246 stop:437 length:192 start_codon:yes stop_codon:yes gene_type:complete